MNFIQIKENCLYVKDLERSKNFYVDVLGLELISWVKDRHIFFRVGNSVLLCFLPEITKEEKLLPPHFAYGKQHLAFEVERENYENWKNLITSKNINIIHEQDWGKDYFSFYFEDPDAHVLEIVMQGM